MKLYKYLKCDKNSIDALINAYSWFSSPYDFNDPFDCALIKSDFLKSKILEKRKIFCMSNDYKNLLMWSHYADSHKGFCIEYTAFNEDDIALLKLKNLLPNAPNNTLALIQNAQRVIYKSKDQINEYLSQFPNSDKDLIIKFKEAQANGNEDSFLSQISDGFYMKHQAWSYESEFRLMIDGEHRHLQPGKITQVFFGAKMSASDKRTIAILIRERYKENCALKCMHINNDIYDLSIRDFDPKTDLVGLGLNL